MSKSSAESALGRHPPPFRPGSDQYCIFIELVKLLYHASFRFGIPWISEQAWDTACNNIDETERLEFLGDGAIGDAVGDIVVKLHPEGTPHGYTQIKQLLTCNAFFAQLMYKLGIAKDETTKEVADAFEAIIGLFKKERGSQGVEDWAWENFGPLAEAAWEIYDEIKYVVALCLEA
ncbi:Ribonuclease 3 1 [Leucoagaricus sp. SymC.cos]|nr:Ribonuclease 3 1 [Leucoagaricus sp. SymC.cos]